MQLRLKPRGSCVIGSETLRGRSLLISHPPTTAPGVVDHALLCLGSEGVQIERMYP